MEIDDVRRVLILGAGTMGLQIGLQCATHGFDVVVYDEAPDPLAAAPGRLRGYADEQVAAGLLDPDGRERALARIVTEADLAAAAADVDLVSESITEDPQLKARALQALDRVCPARTVFATNTSSLLPSMFARESGRPDRLAALHFHTPPWVSSVVDVMPHPDTSASTTELLVAFARRIGQVPIRLHRESYGYVFNAMYNALNREAMTLVANGIASVEDVDRAWMGVMKMPIGPFGMLDGVGVDTAWHITHYWANRLGDPQLQRNDAFLKDYVDRGRIGVKAGAGFYDYPNPAYARPGFLEGEVPEDRTPDA